MQSNHKTPANRAFFALTAMIAIWSAGMALSTVATDAATSEIFRRISAIGWSTAYAILLHFILIITGKSAAFIKKWWFYPCLYLPSLFSLLAFAVPTGINPYPYNLHQTAYGWVNVPHHNVWDWVFYAYYIGYVLIGLFLLYRWGKRSSDNITKKKARIVIISIIAAIFLGTITDVVLNSLFSELPQMAPIIMLIPALAIFHILQKDSFSITEGIDKKTSYLVIFTSILVYIILSALQVMLSNISFTIGAVVFDESAIRGIIVQIQLFISIYLVLKENRPGYISAVLMNCINLLNAVIFLIRNESTASLPGIISYAGVLVIITLAKAYKERIAAYIQRIYTQAIKEEFYSSVFSQAPVGIAIIRGTSYTRNSEFKDISINPAYEKIVGRKKDDLLNITWTDITHPDDLNAELEYFEQFTKGKIDYYAREKRYIKPDGSAVWVEKLLSRFASLDENADEYVCIITDITKRKNIEATLKYNSEHMQPTGLYNRGVLVKILESDASILSVDKRALVCINLSAMHELSLRYGYRYSKTMIKNIADSLSVFSSDNYMLFHTYEYRFVFYVKGYSDKEELIAFCKKVSDILNSYLSVHGIGAGIGVLPMHKTHLGSTDEVLNKLMNISDMAAKNKRNNNNIYFNSPDIDIQIAREHAICQEITEIVKGIETDRLYLQFQPVLEIASNQICGFEALARLHNKKYGLVPPLEFIPLAETANIIMPLGEKIITRALHFLNKLKKNGHDTIAVSINISTIQILEDGFSNRLLEMIADMHLNPENIGIELTESVFATERAEINTVIDTLKDAGIKVLIDDFGTGYSSFARIRELNIDFLKIDKSFIDKLLVLKQEEMITGDIISMAHKLGHLVIAEGVEHENQLSYLRNHSCDRIQGYLISKPLDEDAVLDFLKNNKKRLPLR